MDLAPTPQQPDNGSLHGLLQQVIAADPDLVLMTVGANPLLDDFLMGQGVACALYRDEQTQRQLFDDCIGHFIAQNDVQHRLEAIYAELLSGTTRSHLVVSRYHLAYPAIALYQEWQIQTLLNTVNGKVEAAVAATAAKPGWGDRIALSEPPRFDTGWPGTGQDATCGASVPADGPSHQSFPSQLVLIGRAGSEGFCPSTDFWIISADTGIHPNREGHTQFADSALSVIRSKGWG